MSYESLFMGESTVCDVTAAIFYHFYLQYPQDDLVVKVFKKKKRRQN